MRLSSLPVPANIVASLGAFAAALPIVLWLFASGACAEEISFQQITPEGAYDAVPTTRNDNGFGGADYVTPDGNSVFFSTEGPFPGIPATGGRVDILRASRSDNGTWASTWMSPGADTTFEQNTHDRYFEAASTDGTKVVFVSRDQLDPASVDCGRPVDEGLEGVDCYQRVYEYDSFTGRTTLLSAASVQPETLFDALFVSASPDLATVTWLTPEAMLPVVQDQNSADIYSEREGSAALVSAPSGSVGSVSSTQVLTPEGEASDLYFQPAPGGLFSLSQVPPRSAHLVSADGSELFFQDVRQLAAGAVPGVENVYIRRGQNTTLVSSSAQRTVAPTVSPSDSFFADATPDGQRVFFETQSQLTDGDNNGSVDVYEYNVSTGEVSLISAVGSSEVAAIGGTDSYFVAASADGSHVYFGSRDDLDPNTAPTGAGWKLYERVAGRTHFIALFPELAHLENEATPGQSHCAGASLATHGEDGGDGLVLGGCDQVATLRVTADGTRLIFESAAVLTAGAASGLRCETNNGASEGGAQFGDQLGDGCNIYMYDESTETITLLSPGASGFGAFLTRLPMVTGVGAVDATVTLSEPALISSDGSRVFFSSKDALLPGAVSGIANIYAWTEGTLSLVSPPNETSEAIYDGNSADGSQVFFHSRQSLIPGVDNHGQFAIYDAQLGGSTAVVSTPGPSVAQPAATAPAPMVVANAAAAAAPASTMSTRVAAPARPSTKAKQLTTAQKLAQTLKACKGKRNKKQRAACEKQGRRRYRPPHKTQKIKRRNSR